jgi:hypothetical protein
VSTEGKGCAGCVTFFARWAYDHPESPRRQAVLAEMRRSAKARQVDLTPNVIGDVQRLFDRKLGTSTLQYARVWELVKLYAEHYNHAVPFDEDLLGVPRLDSDLIRHEGSRVNQLEVALSDDHRPRDPQSD